MDAFDEGGEVFEGVDVLEVSRDNVDAHVARGSAFCGEVIDVGVVGEQCFYLLGDPAERGEVVYLEVDARRLFALALEPCQERGGENAGKHGEQRADVEADADGDADNGCRPHNSRRCETGYHFVGLYNYHSRAEKADARNDLRRNAKRVGIIAEHLDRKNADERCEHTAEADEDVPSHTRLTSVPAALDADDAAEKHGEGDAQADGEQTEIRGKFVYRFNKF